MTDAPLLSPPVDPRLQAVEQVMRRHDFRADALIETLHAAQEAYGYLTSNTMRHIADALHIPPAKVYGVCTFYNHFNLKPKGEHTLVVCTGTACHVKGNDRLLQWIGQYLHLTPGSTSPDNQLSLVSVRWVGACALAPVFITDETIMGKKPFDEAVACITEWLDDNA